MASAIAEPFEVIDGYWPPGNDSMPEVPHHLYHTMYKKNAKLWELSGVAQALADPGLESRHERQRNAMLALAAFVHKHGEDWREHFRATTKEELATAYHELWEMANEVHGRLEIAENRITGLEILREHSHLVAGKGDTLLPPSLAHILACSEPHFFERVY